MPASERSRIPLLVASTKTDPDTLLERTVTIVESGIKIVVGGSARVRRTACSFGGCVVVRGQRVGDTSWQAGVRDYRRVGQ